jgi:N-acetylmuramoyl-L-alanine amidase
VRGTSTSTSLSSRVNEANAWGADIFLSLHNNAAENPRASGNEALVYGPGSSVAIALGEDILEELTKTTGLRNRGIVYRPGLYVLKKTIMPAVLVEMGFITNRGDAELLAYSPELFSRGIYRGVLNYYAFFLFRIPVTQAVKRSKNPMRRFENHLNVSGQRDPANITIRK